MAILLLSLSAPAACAEEDELRNLELYDSKPEAVSANRSLRPASQTAENITVVTSKEIEALNAHTLADVLFSLTGLQVEMRRTPGAIVSMQLQGAGMKQILILIDNVPINNLCDNFPNISAVPVQMIERVEIVKGAASSSWGNALGGVVNVITKSPDAERPVSGVVSTSFGQRETIDLRAELRGTQSRFGYYLTGGKLRSDGLLPNNMVDQNNIYAKLNYDLPLDGSLSLTTGLTESASGQLAFSPINVDQDTRDLFSTLSARYPLTDRLSIDASLTARRSRVEIARRLQTDNSLLFAVLSEEVENGASLKVSWLDELQRITAGVDYDHVSSHLAGAQITPDLFKRSADRVGVYLNDTITLGDFALTPSARLDHTEGGGRQFSPSFGITYALTENSLLRGYTAKGYSITSLNMLDSTEKVWTSQVGFESADIPYLWIKGTLFRNDTWNVDVRVGNDDGTVSSIKRSQLKQGYELEARTPPLLGTSFSAGYTYLHATDGDTGAIIKGAPRHTLALGVKYEDSRYLRAFLTGRYIDWNEEGGNKYHDVVWDLHLGKTIDYSDNWEIELFLSVRNLLNSGEFTYPYANIKRWGEVGVRCAF